MLLLSYKLWYRYLKLRRKQVKLKCITDPVYEEVNNAFERSLAFLHKVWPSLELNACGFMYYCMFCEYYICIWLDY